MNAPWQIYFHFVPDSILKNELNCELTWDFNIIKKEIKNYFGDILWKRKGLFSNITQYGNLDETCIEVSTKDNKRCNVVFTFDIRNITEEFISIFCEFAKAMNGSILLSNGNYIKAEYGTVLMLITHSKAAQFCMYIEPFFAIKRDEYIEGIPKWWEYYVPENLKKNNEERKLYIKNYFDDN